MRTVHTALRPPPVPHAAKAAPAGLQEKPQTPPPGSSLKVASYNIHLGIGSDGHFDPERIASVIAELDADVVALQEVQRNHTGFDMLDYLSTAGQFHGIAGPTLVTAQGDYGNAILSRQSPAEVQRWNLSVPRREPRGAIAMTLDKGGSSLLFIATHLGLWPGERRRQIRKLLGHMHHAGAMPTVLMGDLNEWFLWGRPLRWMHRHFQETPALATFPSRWPIFALDRIWVEPRRALVSIAAHESVAARMASDHLPITATIDFAAPTQ